MSEPDKNSQPDEINLTGIDGKSVKLKHSKVLTAKRWYDAAEATGGTTGSTGSETTGSTDQGSQGGQTSNYDAKRDAYADYDPESYKAVLATFKKNKKRKAKKQPQASSGPIYDKVSRTTQTASSRNRADTAHYLRDLSVFGELEFSGDLPRTAGACELPGNQSPLSGGGPAQTD